jgi:hypothetical protein
VCREPHIENVCCDPCGGQCVNVCADPCQDPCQDPCVQSYTVKRLRPCVKRYYDPIRKHWFSVDRLFDTLCKKGLEPRHALCSDCKFVKTYPFKATRLDPCTNHYYKIHKAYDKCCRPHYRYNMLCYAPTKKPWQTGWMPAYIEAKSDPCDPYIPCA